MSLAFLYALSCDKVSNIATSPRASELADAEINGVDHTSELLLQAL